MPSQSNLLPGMPLQRSRIGWPGAYTRRDVLMRGRSRLPSTQKRDDACTRPRLSSAAR